ncbi:hypothetical protein BDV28DRAFT_15118 [Aspergillus coremiiformis]|uniref:Uncharacterized protein n=1 Tax=Aspergillus coremiiformis TaxID=138285 RepID=A0A5N6Z3P4_9EURO|nr:hypothetical protein BDV28DRAFT_15118 [Aspergillus coremiiformis]
MNFPPLEELVQFGRRRKLTEADRERLKSDNQVLREGPLFRRDFRRDMTPSEGETIDGLEIRINGKRAGGGGGVAAEDAQQNNVSSQSMLLDREDPLPREQRISDVLSEDMPSEYSSVLPDYHSSRTSLLSSPSNIWISQSRYRSGSLSD